MDKGYSVRHVKAKGSMPRPLRGPATPCQILISHGIPTYLAILSTFFEANWLLTVAHYALYTIKKIVTSEVTVKFDSVAGFFFFFLGNRGR